MVMQIQIEAFGEVEFNRALLRFSKNAEDPKPAFDAIHTTFLALEVGQFEGQGRYGRKWAPLADSTVTYKARAGLDPRILMATGDLFRSLTELGDEHHVYQTTPDSMFVGSSIGYGVYHQSRQEPRTRLPRRPPVVLPEKTKRQWVKILQSWLIESVANARG